MTVHLLVLNYNGRRLLEACLPSILTAAAMSRRACRVTVIDNASTDTSLAFLAERFPNVPISRQPNRGLCSFNQVLAQIDEPVAILLNNDVKLAPDAIDPLVAPLGEKQSADSWPTLPASAADAGSVRHEGSDGAHPSSCFMTAPLCWRFDGVTYEGLKTAVRWRNGLVQATSLFPGHEQVIRQPDWTASAGAVMAVDRRRFLELGGFDPVYLPGRLEDLDFAFRGFLAGYHARYVPDSVAYHLGFGTFHDAFGETGCDLLALRNTLLFQWLNLRHPRHLLTQLGWLPVRLAADLLKSPGRESARRWLFVRALWGAAVRWATRSRASIVRRADPIAERAFFNRFAMPRLAESSRHTPCAAATAHGVCLLPLTEEL